MGRSPALLRSSRRARAVRTAARTRSRIGTGGSSGHSELASRSAQSSARWLMATLLRSGQASERGRQLVVAREPGRLAGVELRLHLVGKLRKLDEDAVRHQAGAGVRIDVARTVADA